MVRQPAGCRGVKGVRPSLELVPSLEKFTEFCYHTSSNYPNKHKNMSNFNKFSNIKHVVFYNISVTYASDKASEKITDFQNLLTYQNRNRI